MCVSMYISDYCVLLLLNKNNVIFKAKVVETLFFFFNINNKTTIHNN